VTSPPDIDLRCLVVRNALHIGGDPEVDTLLANVLKPGSWTLDYALSNASALNLIDAKSYDLIVINEKAAGKEGIEILRKIRRSRPHARLIILTGESTGEGAICAIREHAFSYFSHPFSPDALAGMIRIAAESPCWDDGIQVVFATQQWMRLRVRCDFESADRLLQFLHEIAELPDSAKKQLAMASRELLYNAIEHGGKLEPTNTVQFDYVRARGMVSCRIADPGNGFAFDKIPHAALANPADDPTQHIHLRQEQGMRPGGYGILMAQQLVDEVIYGNDGSEVLLVKYLDSFNLNPLKAEP
jgi:anti-sigma regulatory factor (Ser/Thr protein kinase)/ActR/RegA family two-component response regulator